MLFFFFANLFFAQLFLFLFPFFLFHTFFLFFQTPEKTSSLLFSSLPHKKIRRWNNIQTKKQRNFLKVLRMEMKKLSKLFFLETKTNNSNLISTSNSNSRRFFFSNSIFFSLSLSFLSLFCCSECDGVWMVVMCDLYFVFVLIFLKQLSFLLKYGTTALHYAAFNGFEQIVKILIEHGSNVNLQTDVFIFFFYLLLWVHCWFVSC